MTDYDSPWKEALDIYFQPFLELFCPQAHAEIDWSRGNESLDKELQKIVREAELGRRFVDKLVKVWLKSGREQWVLVHVEVQSSEDADFAQRMYVYNYRLFDRYNREVASLAILGDDNPRWRPESYGYRRWGIEVGIRFSVAKLLDYLPGRQELEESPNPFATIVLAHLDTLETRQDQHERKNRKFRLIKGLFERGWDTNRVRQLFRLIDWMMELPDPLGIEFWQQVKQFAEEKHMPFITTPERIGLQQGLSQGLSQGRIEGIEALLRLKFGEPGLRLMPEIREIAEIEKLEAILHSIEAAVSPEDLRRNFLCFPSSL
ncbi:MAG: cytosolic protein [Planctomycetota bacterium]